jgi:hypothetical protein
VVIDVRNPSPWPAHGQPTGSCKKEERRKKKEERRKKKEERRKKKEERGIFSVRVEPVKHDYTNGLPA